MVGKEVFVLFRAGFDSLFICILIGFACALVGGRLIDKEIDTITVVAYIDYLEKVVQRYNVAVGSIMASGVPTEDYNTVQILFKQGVQYPRYYTPAQMIAPFGVTRRFDSLPIRECRQILKVVFLKNF